LPLAKNEQEKAAIHFFRGLASARIPGAEIEARLHGSEFVSICQNLANSLVVEANAQEQKAKRNEGRAATIVEQGRSGRLDYSSRLNMRTL
jgi:predicted S18 family serine protease